MSQQLPSLGRIVLFRSVRHGFMVKEEYPAIVCAVNSDDSTVDLRVFTDAQGSLPCVDHVPYNDNIVGALPNSAGYWRWPPRT